LVKKLNYIHLALEIVNFSVIPIMLFIKGINSPEVFITFLVCLLLVYPILSLLFMLVKEAKIVEYDTPKMFPVRMSLYVLIGCLIWYLFYHLDFNYANTLSLWYGGLALGFVLPIFVCEVIEKINDKKKKNGPRFINNGRYLK